VLRYSFVRRRGTGDPKLDEGQALAVCLGAKSGGSEFGGFTIPGLSIRMVAGFAEVADRKEFLVAGACNHPNLLVLPFSFELVHAAA
jgi:hypothetical protein